MSRPQDLAYAIHQAASEPHDTDAVNAIFNQYLLKTPLPDSLPEDPQGYAELLAYATQLRLPDNNSQPVRSFANGWDGLYNLHGGHFHVHPELRPFGDQNLYRDFYNTEDEYVKTVSIALHEDSVECILNGNTCLKARLDGKLIPHQTLCTMPAYTWECSTAVFEHNELIIDTWFYQTCFKTRMWLKRDGAILRVIVRKERLHDDVPYIWYKAEFCKTE